MIPFYAQVDLDDSTADSYDSMSLSDKASAKQSAYAKLDDDGVKKAKEKDANRQIKVLNLFAYTGGATLACAAAGAHVTHVDASKGMVNWAKENAQLSGLREKPIRWLVDDCVKFVAVSYTHLRAHET